MGRVNAEQGQPCALQHWRRRQQARGGGDGLPRGGCAFEGAVDRRSEFDLRAVGQFVGQSVLQISARGAAHFEIGAGQAAGARFTGCLLQRNGDDAHGEDHSDAERDGERSQ